MTISGQSRTTYLNNLYVRERLKTRVVSIGDVPMGGDFPIRIQSMTNTATSDIKATVAQARQLFEAGCDYVRITARNLAEAEDLAVIKKQLHKDGFRNPLVADIHFNPEVALVAARHVEKVRINPGNYVGEYSLGLAGKKDENDTEPERIAERIRPLIDVCKEYGTAMRVGTNHGSLSQRILGRFGNTPEGMVYSAMEFAGIISSMGFHQLVLSMKSSDIRVMVHAYRLLVKSMRAEGFDYPLHLGVTEAGAGEDGIIRSAAGMGALLADGIGDTLRVSLTGNPLQEVPVARKLAVMFDNDKSFPCIQPEVKAAYDPFTYNKRETDVFGIIGGDQPFAVISGEEIDNVIIADDIDQTDRIIGLCPGGENKALVIECGKNFPPAGARYVIHRLIASQCMIPVVLKPEMNMDAVEMAAYFSALLIDGYGDAIWTGNGEKDKKTKEAALSLLQVHGLRRTRAEFISCPTCGRTSYNVEKVLEEVRSLTGHLIHLKIAVMGCIVNGPGEMADADYGCVGAGPGKVNLYRGREIVKKNVPESQAARQLSELILGEVKHTS